MNDGGGVEIRLLCTSAEMRAVERVLQQVWGTSTPLAGVELLCAIAHAGGYVAAAYDSGNVVGASFGFLASHHGERALHSHVTGLLPGVQHSGLGRAMKNHQREWAAGQGLAWVTWTFDPLVRRNAWFNIGVLGARVAEYLVDFYGPMQDALNANDESDRLLAAWPVEPSAVEPEHPGTDVVHVPTPEDIVVLRRTDPEAAHAWRTRVRAELGGALERGDTVVGFTRDGDYLVAAPR